MATSIVKPSSRLVFTPIEASNSTEEYVKELRSNDGSGMPLYIPKMEYQPKDGKGFLPVKRGEIITVLGRPGNGKTAFLLRWARTRAKDLQKQAAFGNEVASKSVVLYWTMEQLVEELRLFHVAAEEGISASDMAASKLPPEKWEAVNNSLRGMHTIPLWFGGKSLARRKDKIKMTEQTLREAMESIEVWQGENIKTQIDCVIVDYLQRFRAGGSDWVMFYSDLVNGLKDIATDFATRMIVGVQARREVDARDVPIPDSSDGQWSSAIEQQSDGMLSVTRPSHYKGEGESFDGMIVKGHNQMIVSVLKRKLGPENWKAYISLSPEFNKLDEMELKYVNFEGQDE